MNPNRRNHGQDTAARRSKRGDDVAIHLALLVLGCIPVATALVRGGSWGAEPAVSLLLFLCVGWAALRERALPEAAQHDS